MAASKSKFESTPFKFIVDDHEFYVLADLLTQLSPTFNQDINGLMKEATQGCAVIEDVDAATFDRFIEWAYKGYYTTPPPTLTGSLAGQETEDAAAEVQPGHIKKEISSPGDRVFDCPNCGELRYETTELCNECFQQMSHQHGRERINHKRAFTDSCPQIFRHGPPPICINDPDTSYGMVLLCHAQLYVFVESRSIESLKTLALNELYNLLASLELVPGYTEDILSLIQYVYSHTVQTESEKAEPMRELLKQYITAEMKTLATNNYLLQLAFDLGPENGKDFLKDFMSIVKERL